MNIQASHCDKTNKLIRVIIVLERVIIPSPLTITTPHQNNEV